MPDVSRVCTINFRHSFDLSEDEKRLWTKPTRVLNPAENMAVKFTVTCRAKGYKIMDISVEMSNQTINCEEERQLCGGNEQVTPS